MTPAGTTHRVETSWDGDEWASFGETYNPRTGVSTQTERYYDDDKNRAQWWYARRAALVRTGKFI